MSTYLKLLFVCSVVALASTSCHREPSAQAAASDLEKAFQAKLPEPPPAAAPDVLPAPTGDQVKDAVNRAVIAIRTNAYAEAFVTLRAVQAAPTLSVAQYSAIENARLALEREVANKAAAGDAAAQKAVQQINKLGH